MLTCLRRGALIVNDEKPGPYFPGLTPGVMLSNGADCHCVVRPNLPATALKRSTSKPITVLPSVSRNSFGAYVESVPMTSLPADLISAGTFAASAVSTDDDGAGAPAEPALPLPLSDSEPQAASDTVSVAATARPRRVRGVRNICDS